MPAREASRSPTMSNFLVFNVYAQDFHAGGLFK